MSQATQLKYGPVTTADRASTTVKPPVTTIQESPARERPGLVERLVGGLRSYWLRSAADSCFRWNVPTSRIGDVRPEMVFCVELPVSDPAGMLASYMASGVRPEHVVFVGDPLTMKDNDYYRITQQGALVHETKKRSHRQTEDDLTPYYAQTRSTARPTSNPNPYTYEPGAPAVTQEQLQALIDAIAAKRP